MGGKCLVQSPSEVDLLMATNLEQADFWVETRCISGFVSQTFDHEVFWLSLWAKLSCMTTPEEQVSWLQISVVYP